MSEPVALSIEPRDSAPTAAFRPAADAALALADGRVFRGRAFGAVGVAEGEAVFTTTMTGYQEVCTDPSFRRQIVCMTYPLIGNYGVNDDDDQSRRPWIAGLVVREQCEEPSNWRSIGTLDAYLKRHGIPGIAGVDTRALTRHIRAVGDTRAVLVHDAVDLSDHELVERARRAPLPGEVDAVEEVAADEIEVLGPASGPHIVLIDCGVKRNIVRSLVDRGARVTVVPYGTPYSDVSALGPDGVIVSPGPGDPANLDEGLDVVREVLDHDTPFFGICLGHQILARAIGAETDKLKFGHRGGNHPVLDLRSGHVSITSQNHGFRVLADTLPSDVDWTVALVNLNDRSVEGLAHRTKPVISVQFHPEASPGPWDNAYLFDSFLAMVERRRRTGSDPERGAT
jgi:carbamoyl-phosphate synthase small subunit